MMFILAIALGFLIGYVVSSIYLMANINKNIEEARKAVESLDRGN